MTSEGIVDVSGMVKGLEKEKEREEKGGRSVISPVHRYIEGASQYGDLLRDLI